MNWEEKSQYFTALNFFPTKFYPEQRFKKEVGHGVVGMSDLACILPFS